MSNEIIGVKEPRPVGVKPQQKVVTYFVQSNRKAEQLKLQYQSPTVVQSRWHNIECKCGVDSCRLLRCELSFNQGFSLGQARLIS